MNWVIVSGRLCRDPEMKASQKTGKMFCLMRFAIEGDYRGVKRERETNFVDMMAFDKRGETMHRYLRKGMRCIMLGELKVYDRVDAYGNKREHVVIVVRTYEMIDSHVTKEPIEDLMSADGTYLIPKEITRNLIRQIDTADEDVPEEFVERGVDDLLQIQR